MSGPFEPGLPAPGIPAGTTLVEPELDRPRPQLDEPGDHERFSHYVPKDKLMAALVEGTPVIALCGKVWVPSRDPKRFPVCPTCKEIWETLGEGAGKGDGDRGGGKGGGDQGAGGDR